MKKWLKRISVMTACVALNLPAFAQENSSLDRDTPYLSGFYIGGHGGFIGYSMFSNSLEDGYFSVSSLKAYLSFQTDKTSWVAGAQIGYDWLRGHQLFGLVADWDWTDAKSQFFDSFLPPYNLTSLMRKVRWFSTVRARLGLAWCQTLLYLTAGAAVADLKTLIQGGVDALDLQAHRFHQNCWGWTGGLGLDFVLGCNWSAYAECLYMSFDSHSLTFFASGFEFSGNYSFDFHDEMWVGRIGLNYHFSFF